jgi:hypothetical protein
VFVIVQLFPNCVPEAAKLSDFKMDRADIFDLEVYGNLLKEPTHLDTLEICELPIYANEDIIKEPNVLKFEVDSCAVKMDAPKVISGAEVSFKVVKSKRFKCASCCKDYSSNCALKAHINAIHELRRIICIHCLKSYRWKGDFYLHLKTTHSVYASKVKV